MAIDISEIKSADRFTQLRHRWEMPLIWISFLVTVSGIMFGAWALTLDEATMQTYFGESSQSVADAASFAVMVLILPIGMFFYRFYMAAKAKANAIRVGPNQLPKLWELYQELGKKLQMERLPKLYVTNGNGVVNAYALSCNTRHKYIVLHSETVMAMAEAPEIVEFVLAHEMAHHKLGHVSLWRIAIGLIPDVLVPLGISTTRAQEYSADRVAKSVCDHDHHAMKLLAIGPWMHGDVDSEAWLEQCEEDRKELFVRFANVMSNHAVMSKRYKALRDIDTGGFEKHGDMF